MQLVTEVAVAVADGEEVVTGVAAGVAVTPAPARPGLADATGETAVVGTGVAAVVLTGLADAAVAAGVVVDTGERDGEGIVSGLLGAGAGAEGQRPQVAAQKPPAGAPLLNMKAALHCPKPCCCWQV